MKVKFRKFFEAQAKDKSKVAAAYVWYDNNAEQLVLRRKIKATNAALTAKAAKSKKQGKTGEAGGDGK